MGIKNINGAKKKKKEMYAITNFSLKNISKIIKNFRSSFTKVMCGRGPNMNLLNVTFIHKDRLLSV